MLRSITILFTAGILLAGCDTTSVIEPDSEMQEVTEEAILVPHALMEETQTGQVSKSPHDDYTCFISLYHPKRGWEYQYFLATALFSAEAVANAEGDRAHFQYRVKRRNGELSGFANCDIPADIRAVNQMANALRHYRDRPLPKLDLRDGTSGRGGPGKQMPDEGEMVCYAHHDGMTCWFIEEIIVEDHRIGGSEGHPPDWWGDLPGDDFFPDYRRGGSRTAGTEANETLGKLIKVVRKLLRKARSGEDLLDPKVWKRILKEEWAEVAHCAAGIATASLNAAGLFTILDCIANLTLGLKTDDGVAALKHLGLFDEFIQSLSKSKYWDSFVNTLRTTPYFGDIVNAVSDLGTLYDLAKLSKLPGKRIYVLNEGSASAVFSNFAKSWGVNPRNYPDGTKVLEGRSNTLTLYLSHSSNEYTIGVKGPFGGGLSPAKIRFGRR